jgi:hypothetical protein
MSALGHKRTYAAQNGMSALAPEADMCGATSDVRFGPKADMSCNGTPAPGLEKNTKHLSAFSLGKIRRRKGSKSWTASSGCIQMLDRPFLGFQGSDRGPSFTARQRFPSRARLSAARYDLGLDPNPAVRESFECDAWPMTTRPFAFSAPTRSRR